MRCRLLLLGVAVLAVAGCSGSGGAIVGPSATATASAVRLPCTELSAPYAWAEEVTLDGQARWRTLLAADSPDDTAPSVLEPLVDGPTTVFAQDGLVLGLSSASGRQVWSYTGPQLVSGLWQWRGVVVVLTTVEDVYTQLIGLDAATGAIRWRLNLPRGGVAGPPVATADGGLGLIRADGTLEVVSMATGVVRWTRSARSWLSLTALGSTETTVVNGLMVNIDTQGLTTADDVLIAVGDYGTIGYDDRTGSARWKIADGLALPVEPQQLFADGDAVLASGNGGDIQFDALSAIAPASGRIVWQAVFRSARDSLVAGAGPAGVAVDDGSGVSLVDPRTGRQRWASGGVDGVELVGRGDVVTIEEDQDGSSRLVDRDPANGRARWSVPGFGQAAMAAGLLIVQNAIAATLDAYRLGTGALAWRAPLPAGYWLRLAVVPGGVLVQARMRECNAP